MKTNHTSAHSSFVSLSCLPLTMELANKQKKAILKTLGGTPNEWLFEDRVLAWLSPPLKKRIIEYHESSGKRLCELFEKESLIKYDKFFKEELHSRLRSSITLCYENVQYIPIAN